METQLERASAFAIERGVDHRAFQEQASAKSITGRPVLSGLLAELEDLPVRQRPKFLFITALDRLSRDMIDGMYIGRILRALKVILYVDGRGEVHLDTFAERAVFVGESMGGDAENEAKSKRMRDSWDRRRREGKTTSNKVPYGLQLRGERDVPVPDSAEWVLKAFEWYSGGDGCHIIGHRMKANAPPHTWLTTRVGEDGERIQKTRAGTRWEALRVMKLLKQKRYRGTIVPVELFDRVQGRIAAIPKRGSRTEREYPLSGAMRCEGCSRRLHGHASGSSSTATLADGTRKRYPREPTRYYTCQVCSYMLNAERVEQRFFSDIAHLAADENLVRRWITAPHKSVSEVAPLRRDAKVLERELSDEIIAGRRDRLFDLAIAASLDELEFKRQMRRLEEDILEKRQRLAALRSSAEAVALVSRNFKSAAALLSRYREIYDSASYEMKRELVRTIADALGGFVASRTGVRWLSKSDSAQKTFRQVGAK